MGPFTLMDPVAIIDDTMDVEKVYQNAEALLDGLPDLKYKCVLTWNKRPERLFDEVFLVASDHVGWWERYELILTEKQYYDSGNRRREAVLATRRGFPVIRQ